MVRSLSKGALLKHYADSMGWKTLLKKSICSYRFFKCRYASQQ